MSVSPVFVVGTPRSGTTLTARILGRHPEFFMGGENHFFEDIYARRSELGDPSTDRQARLRISQRLLDIYGRYNQHEDQDRINQYFSAGSENLERLNNCTSYRQFLDCFMETQAGAIRWGNNTPKDIFHVDAIREFYPDAIIVVCVRDLRDFLVSYGLRWTVTSEAHRERLRKLYHPVLTALLWRSTALQLQRLQEVMPDSKLCLVRYEDLVQEPEATVQRLCATCGLDYSADLLAVQADNSSLGHGGRGIFTRSVGSWRERLPAADAWLAEKTAGSLLARLGYERAAPWPGFVPLLRTLLMFPFAALRALHANRAHRGPLLQYLRRRLTTPRPVSSADNRTKEGRAGAR